QLAYQSNQSQDTEFLTAILAVRHGQSNALPEEHPYAATLEEIEAGIATGGLQGEKALFAVSNEVVLAVRDFVNAHDWIATLQVVEA
ncbi:MAG TPA: hypothetical protein VIY29_02455, partial [Ktedonobacteraceae bacterium]